MANVQQVEHPVREHESLTALPNGGEHALQNVEIEHAPGHRRHSSEPGLADLFVEGQIHGECPAYIRHLPGAIKVDDVADRHALEREARKYLATFPDLRSTAQRLGKDLVAFASAYGKEIVVGVGIASAITGGVVLYRHPARGIRGDPEDSA
jgi:hypothetical protein